MQTFLPYPSFFDSAAALDPVRRGKQCSEALQILRIVTGDTADWKNPKAWANHPAVRMWRGHAYPLSLYLTVMLAVDAGYYQRDLRAEYHRLRRIIPTLTASPDPPWLGREDLHLSHRANLVRKKPEYYIPSFGKLEPMPYVWPV